MLIMNTKNSINDAKKNIKTEKNKTLKIVIISIIIVVLVLVSIIIIFVNSKLNKISYESNSNHSYLNIETNKQGNIINNFDEDDSEDGIYKVIDSDEAARIAEKATLAALNSDIFKQDGVLNILLIGTDNRVKGENSRSDAMILLSINKNNQKIVMNSLMRDMYVSIPNYGNTKLNHSNAYGGPTLLMETVRNNFAVDVNNYISVDFYSLANIIDILGGIPIDVEEGEIEYLNQYVYETNKYNNLPSDANLVNKSGKQILNGSQAVAYARIRYYGNADFQRTERQRTVLTEMIEKIKGASIKQLNSILDDILPNVETNMKKMDIVSLVGIVPTIIKYPIEQQRIPADGTFYFASIDGLSCLVPNIEENRQLLKDSIYE